MDQPIDVVIAWVDGDDPALKAKKDRFLAEQQQKQKLSNSGKATRRWENRDEILLCLQSIESHAPWVRKIWIVTDNQSPDLSSLNVRLRKKIAIVDHREIFRGFEQYLPTFNSLSIETVLWRIKGLADRYLYFNDDFFLVGDLAPEDFFEGDKPVIRGRWTDWTGSKFSMYRRNKLNAAEAMGYTIDNVFSNAHVAYTFNKKILEAYYDQHPEVLEKNLSHRFREHSQLSSISLQTHWGIPRDLVVLKTQKDWLNVSVGVCQSGDAELIKQKLTALQKPKIKLGCINDLAAAQETCPETLELLHRAIGIEPAKKKPRPDNAKQHRPPSSLFRAKRKLFKLLKLKKRQ
ncbi:Stealth protein CR1, conserved region 1 [Kushneria avicenniae]|uniref:Stealth protein CR1, conserved region 1 n=2 Tax=Kushneria avicenniae TaxID=402385 RepID=A0A1I1IA87_9GAMM|nr:Stealth protein CR1, conserved region 1 [Kushneria avicenniae]